MRRHLFYPVFFRFRSDETSHIRRMDMYRRIFTLMLFKKAVKLGRDKAFYSGRIYSEHAPAECLYFSAPIALALLEIHYVKFYIFRHRAKIVEYNAHHAVCDAYVRHKMQYSHIAAPILR